MPKKHFANNFIMVVWSRKIETEDLTFEVE